MRVLSVTLGIQLLRKLEMLELSCGPNSNYVFEEDSGDTSFRHLGIHYREYFRSWKSAKVAILSKARMLVGDSVGFHVFCEVAWIPRCQRLSSSSKPLKTR